MNQKANVQVTLSAQETILQRRSVRGYLDKPVPPETLEAIFSLAQQAPSNCNIQPWRIYVASGQTRDNIKTQLTENVLADVPFNPDFSLPDKFPGVYRDRQIDCAMALYNEMGVDRKDKEARFKTRLRNFELFDAPHACFIGMNRDFSINIALDVGMYIQTLMLAMTSYGVSSCAQGCLRYYPDLVRETFSIDNEIGILVGISFGYEDKDVPANRARTERADLAESVVFYD